MKMRNVPKMMNDEIELHQKIQGVELHKLFERTVLQFMCPIWDWNDTPRDIENEIQHVYKNFMKRSSLRYNTIFPRVIDMHLNNKEANIRCHLSFGIYRDGSCKLLNREELKLAQTNSW
jgi:hypothetical protein